ncbi:MAG: hypothetical protein U0U66_07765 [Cytophagaceae bacterium]
MMKLLFLCSSLEPGKDGVGDYTRRLAIEMQSKGYKVMLIAINDKFVLDIPNEVEIQYLNEEKVEVWRYPSGTIKKNIQFILSKIESYNPEIASLQFVIYGYHPKGLPFYLPKALQQLLCNYKVHIMFHELWVGMNREASLKHKIYGRLQKKIVTQLLFKINPSIITTNTGVYQWQLKKMGWDASILPLMSNIKNYNIGERIKNEYNIVLFGGLHRSNRISKFIEETIIYAKESNLKLKYIFIGRNGLELKDWLYYMERYKMNFEVLGLKSEREISLILNTSHVGVVTTPKNLKDKSGVCKAYEVHNLKIVYIGEDWNVINWNENTDSLINVDVFDTFENLIKFN